jgi:glycogen debranching enzyme
MEHLDSAGLGYVSEITDADPPQTARGYPFQAWSLGEMLRLDRVVLADAAMAQRCIEPAPNNI